MSDAVIEISGLTKSFGRKSVLDGVDLTVPRGSIFGSPLISTSFFID